MLAVHLLRRSPIMAVYSVESVRRKQQSHSLISIEANNLSALCAFSLSEYNFMLMYLC